ncbi:hypothetical protein SORBI_3002G343901 [Sorghum bicolor]|uniref:Uncharacterized protein n=2 Tax=Sorghum bicolor TaxID=4558 RepID=A0A1W0W6S4_SORBI|nr:hypothetical protein SORBI_3002G343901 [Sorghum bicolor]
MARIEDRLVKSVVIVGETESTDYCIGLVAEVTKDETFVLTQSSFVQDKGDRIKVSFFDKTELLASVVAIDRSFCMLRTARHCDSERVYWEEGPITAVSQALIFLPFSSTNVSCTRIFVTLESSDSYHMKSTVVVDGSDEFFLVSCPYTEKTNAGFDRLLAAPVFSMSERALGIVLFDYNPDSAAEKKVCYLAKGVMAQISRLLPSPELPAYTKRRGAEDQKKGKKRRII